MEGRKEGYSSTCGHSKDFISCWACRRTAWAPLLRTISSFSRLGVLCFKSPCFSLGCWGAACCRQPSSSIAVSQVRGLFSHFCVANLGTAEVRTTPEPAPRQAPTECGAAKRLGLSGYFFNFGILRAWVVLHTQVASQTQLVWGHMDSWIAQLRQPVPPVAEKESGSERKSYGEKRDCSSQLCHCNTQMSTQQTTGTGSEGVFKMVRNG